jgi:hypothetical protein
MVRAGATRILHGLFGLRPWGNKTKPNQNKPKKRKKKKIFTAWTLEDLRAKSSRPLLQEKRERKTVLEAGDGSLKATGNKAQKQTHAKDILCDPAPPEGRRRRFHMSPRRSGNHVFITAITTDLLFRAVITGVLFCQIIRNISLSYDLAYAT